MVKIQHMNGSPAVQTVILLRKQKKKETESEIRDAIGIVGRDLTDTERQYIWAWVDMGFSPELIAAAYDKALTSKRTYSPAYVNGILRNWKAKGIQTIADLEKEHDIFITKQPTNAVRNSEIFRNYMDFPDHNAFDYRSLSLLAASDRIQHVNKVIEPEMKKGKIVLSDRYFYSCLSNLRARGFENDEWIYEVAESVIKPDLSFFLDVPVEEAVARVRRRPEEKDRYIDMELQYKLRKEYADICYSNDGIFISTMQPEAQSYAVVKKAIKEMLQYGNF